MGIQPIKEQNKADATKSLSKSKAGLEAVLSRIQRNHGLAPAARMRETALLNLVERATGKRVPGRDSEDTVAAFGGPLVNEPSGETSGTPPEV